VHSGKRRLLGAQRLAVACTQCARGVQRGIPRSNRIDRVFRRVQAPVKHLNTAFTDLNAPFNWLASSCKRVNRAFRRIDAPVKHLNAGFIGLKALFNRLLVSYRRTNRAFKHLNALFRRINAAFKCP
jgi:hypothetical protein